MRSVLILVLLAYSGLSRGACTFCENCAICSDSSPHPTLVGFNVLTIDLTNCKDDASTISWACCKGSDANVGGGSCELYDCNNPDHINGWEPHKSKCNEVTEISFVVPNNATSITLQLHDGRFLGTVDPRDPPLPLCGGSGTSCSGAVSGVCQIVLNISSCVNAVEPDCVSDDDCDLLDDSCAYGACDNGQCVRHLKPAGTVCRPAMDLCDHTETCTGFDVTCPVDLRKDHAYTFKCATRQYLCAVTPAQLTTNANGNNNYLGTCGIGSALGGFVELPWPECATSCISYVCPNNRYLSNYALATCIPSTGLWNCTAKVDIGVPSGPICPYNTP